MHPILCAHLIIFLELFNLEIIKSTPPRIACIVFLCVICNSSRFHSILSTLLVNTLKICTSDAGQEQSLVSFSCENISFYLSKKHMPGIGYVKSYEVASIVTPSKTYAKNRF